MKKIHILAVGKLREPHWQAAAAFYLNRLKRSITLTEQLVKDAIATRPDERNDQEGKRLLAVLAPNHYPICLDERGRQFTSLEFAAFLSQLHEQAEKTPCFIIGGAFGRSPAVLGMARTTLSFGSMTLPHELARVLLLEQIYRADQIGRKSPYHH
jgi:23S rRNA (pseudouridine1915-N3)-methyltransferase